MTYTEIPGYPAYEVSNVGTMRKKLSSGSYRVINPWQCGKHFMVTLTDEYKQKRSFYIHRLVQVVYGPEQPADMPLVCHRDDDPSHNHIDNLEWGNKQTNARMAVANGKLCPAIDRVYLTREEARQVREQFATGKSMRQLATIYGCSRWTISNIVRNKTLRFIENK
jgi:hypothetical protein